MVFNMPIAIILVILLGLTALAYHHGRKRAFAVAEKTKDTRLHSLPHFYGAWTAIWCSIPALLVLGVWLAMQGTVITGLVVSELPENLQQLTSERLGLVVNDIRNHASGSIVSGKISPEIEAAAERYKELRNLSRMALTVVILCLAIGAAAFSTRFISPKFRARNSVEGIIKTVLIICSSIAILTTLGIVLSVLFEAMRFFDKIPATEFLFGTTWSPQTAIRADQVGSSGAFGAIPLFTGTLLISFIAMLVAVPIGLLSAIYLSEYAGPRLRAVTKPFLEILAGIPTVVYGFFAALTVAPFIRDGGAFIGLTVSSESALAAGLVMGIMIIPFVSSLSDDVINAVPQSLRDASFGVGATHSETVRQVVLPAALPGIAGGILLAVSRAIGETMIVVMAAGLAANLTANPLDSVTTVTVQIVTLLVGDQEFDSPKTLAAFALGLTLFLVTLVLNVIALHIVRKYREQYD